MRWLPFLGLIILISLGGFFIPQVRAASSGKLGLFVIYFSDGGEKVTLACPKIMTFYDPQNDANRQKLLNTYKTKCPGGTSVLRLHDVLEGKKYTVSQDPVNSADDIFASIQKAVNNMPQDARNMIDYVSGTNEFDQIPVLDSQEAAEWTAKFWTRLAENIKNILGKKPNIGDINVGFPHDINLIKYLMPAFKKVKEMGGAISYHGYTVDYAMDVNTELKSALRYQLYYEYINKDPQVSGLPLLITETGAAEAGTGIEQKYAGYMPNNIEKFKKWLEWYDSELQKDTYVVGATIFQSGETGQWASFNTDHIAEWLCTKLGGTDCKVKVAPYNGSESSPVDKCAKKPSKVEELKQFLSNLFKKNVTDLKRINKGDLPPLNIDSGGAKKEDDCVDEAADTVLEGAQQYNIAASRGQPPSETSSLNWWQSALDKVIDAFPFGNKKAEEYLNASLPPNVGTEILVSEGQPLASQGETLRGQRGQGVLGIFGSKDKAMERALSVKYCAGLPAGLCGEDSMPLGTKKDTVSPTPGVGEVGQYPEIVPPPGCGQADSGTDGYTGNECALVQTGWCSVSCLKRFTDGNIETAARLSQICMLESGGNPVAGPNTGCLKGRTQEYSVGLFQINLIDRCSGGILNEWAERKICTILDENIFNQCVADMEDPIQNINKAYSLTNGGWNWNPWKIASERCGFIDPIDPGPR